MRFFFLFLLVLPSCLDSGAFIAEVPDKLIQKEKFSIILEELMLIESHIQSEIPQLNLSIKSLNKSSELIFKKYKVDKKSFESSFEYYASDQHGMKSIYSTILERMAKKASKIHLPR